VRARVKGPPRAGPVREWIAQPPAPVQNAIIANTYGSLPGAIDSTKRFDPSTFRTRNEPGLTDGSSMNNQTRTDDAPASAPGM